MFRMKSIYVNNVIKTPTHNIFIKQSTKYNMFFCQTKTLLSQLIFKDKNEMHFCDCRNLSFLGVCLSNFYQVNIIFKANIPYFKIKYINKIIYSL